MPRLTCAKCGIEVTWPDSLTAEDKAVFADMIRCDGLRGMKLAQARFDLSVQGAKALLFHITRRRGECHRCARPTGGGDVSTCGHCHALNLDW